MPTTEPTRTAITANGVEFACLELGEGPLALCLHGFPDSATSWRHLLPALADAGYRAVAPWTRGYAPTAVPADGAYQTGALATDAVALHEALGGDGDAVIVGHDWGAFDNSGQVVQAGFQGRFLPLVHFDHFGRGHIKRVLKHAPVLIGLDVGVANHRKERLPLRWRRRMLHGESESAQLAVQQGVSGHALFSQKTVRVMVWLCKSQRPLPKGDNSP